MRASFALVFTALATSVLAATAEDALRAVSANLPGGLTRRQVPTIPGASECPVCQDSMNSSSACSSSSDPLGCICKQSTIDGLVNCIQCAGSKGNMPQSFYDSAQESLNTIQSTCGSNGKQLNVPKLSASTNTPSTPSTPSNGGGNSASNPLPSSNGGSGSGSGSGSGNGSGTGSGNGNGNGSGSSGSGSGDPFAKGNSASTVRVAGVLSAAAAVIALFA